MKRCPCLGKYVRQINYLFIIQGKHLSVRNHNLIYFGKLRFDFFLFEIMPNNILYSIIYISFI